MSDEIETIDKNPKSWAAWKREAERLQAIIDDMVLAAMESEPVAWQIHTPETGVTYVETNPQSVENIRNGYGIKVEITPLYRHAQPVPERDNVRREHAEWSQSTFGNVGPVGPLKHLSKEALEAAAEPGDLSEWADMQFLLWDAQRRAGITDEQITRAMIEKLAVNKQREWPEPKDGEPRLHIKAQPAPAVLKDHQIRELVNQLRDIAIKYHAAGQLREQIARVVRSAMLQAVPLANEGDIALHNYRTALEGIGHIRRTLEETFGGLHGTHVEPDVLMDCNTICDAIYAAYSGNSPVIPDGYVMVPIDLLSELRDWAHPEIEKYCEMWKGRRDSEFPALRKVIADADAMLAAAPQPQNAPQNIPEIIPGWIPVSEQMPPSRHEVLVGRWWGEKPRWCCKWATYIPGHPDAQSSGWLIPGASWTPTHWMPLPAAPQEVKGE